MPRLYTEAARNVIRRVLGWRLPEPVNDVAPAEQLPLAAQGNMQRATESNCRRQTIVIRSRDEVALLACSPADMGKRKVDDRPPLRRIRPCRHTATQ
eukprot:1040896-Amphidinium_carterae.1